MLYDITENNHTTSLAKVLCALLERSGKRIPDWRAQAKINREAQLRLLAVPSDPVNRAGPYYNAIRNCGAKIIFSFKAPDSTDKPTSYEYENERGLAQYIFTHCEAWAKRNDLTQEKMATMMGIARCTISLYMNPQIHRASPFAVIRDFHQLDFTMDVDIIHPDIDSTIWEQTIPEDTVVSEIVAIDPKAKTEHRRLQVYELVRRIYKASYKDVPSLSVAIKSSAMHTRALVSDYGILSNGIHAYASVIHKVDGSVQYRFKWDKSEILLDFELDSLDMAKEFSRTITLFMSMTKAPVSAVARKIGIIPSQLGRLLDPNRRSLAKIETYLNACRSIGIDVDLIVSHPSVGRTVISMTSDEAVSTETAKVSSVTDYRDLASMMSDKEISNMMRGNVKTTLGETIKPFL